MKIYCNLKSFFFALILFISFFFNNYLLAEMPAEKNAKEILGKVKSTYNNLQTYKDSGIVNLDNTLKIDHLENDKQEFKTYYIKPDLFLFRWVNYSNMISTKTLKPVTRQDFNTILANGNNIFSFYTYKQEPLAELTNEPSIREAIVYSLGLTYGSCGAIPSLVFEDLNKSLDPITDLVDPILSIDENIEGKKCFHIVGRHPVSGNELHLWIERDDYLIRKIKKILKNGIVEITYKDIFVNIDIPIDIFSMSICIENDP